MDLNRVFLSIYSYGYSAGFIQDSRFNGEAIVDLNELIKLSKNYGLGGIEIPLDRYFKEPTAEILDFVKNLDQQGLRVTFDLEEFDPIYLKKALPILSESMQSILRVKVSNFYGGNRFRHPEFKEHLAEFKRGMRSVADDLDKYGVRLLVENHQDISLDEILDLVSEFGSNRIGLNWDLGSSLALGWTVEQFREKAGQFVGNIHLKDYQMVKCDGGFRLVRCALGAGVVDFKAALGRCEGDSISEKTPMSIELGAQNAREAFVDLDEYWVAFPEMTRKNRKRFMEYVHEMATDAPWESLWEKKAAPKQIVKGEHLQMDDTVKFLKGLVL